MSVVLDRTDTASEVRHYNHVDRGDDRHRYEVQDGAVQLVNARSALGSYRGDVGLVTMGSARHPCVSSIGEIARIQMDGGSLSRHSVSSQGVVFR